jgi:hypothetical protein
MARRQCVHLRDRAHGQPAKEINQQAQLWWSLNSTTRGTDRWGVVQREPHLPAGAVRGEAREGERASPCAQRATLETGGRGRCPDRRDHIPVSSKRAIPSLVLSDEVLLQFGSGIVLNTFDQNRLFAGLKKSLSRSWSFDLGYMLVYQQKPSGFQYDLNHTVRWFFCLSPDLRPVSSRTNLPEARSDAGGDSMSVEVLQ